MKAYRNFLRVEVDSTNNGWQTEAATDIIKGKVLTVGSKVEDIKKGMDVEFQYQHAKRMSTLTGVIYYVKDEAIMGYEDNNKK